jgi:hypothetical protein
MACTEQAAAPPTAQTNTLQLDPSAFVEDLYNAVSVAQLLGAVLAAIAQQRAISSLDSHSPALQVHFYCADGFDTMDRCGRSRRITAAAALARQPLTARHEAMSKCLPQPSSPNFHPARPAAHCASSEARC